MNKNNIVDLSDVTYVKRISVGTVNPNSPLTEEQLENQMALVNRCLSESPKGTIIGKEISVGIYQFGEHQITMQKTTYHVGFKRKPFWIDKD